jgi:hypothetical protein
MRDHEKSRKEGKEKGGKSLVPHPQKTLFAFISEYRIFIF